MIQHDNSFQLETTTENAELSHLEELSHCCC